MKILIAEADPSTVMDLKTILTNLNHDVVAVVSSGEEALQKTGDLNPHLVLIDIKLEGEMSGVEAADRVANLQGIPIIFLTVFIKNCLNKSLQLPEDAVVLSKPIRQEHLEYSIRRAFLD